MIEVARPPRRMEMGWRKHKKTLALRERGKRLYMGMSAMAESVDTPSEMAVLPRKAGRRRVHNPGTVNRVWIERRELPRFGDPDEVKTHMYFKVDTFNLSSKEPTSSPIDSFGITPGGKLLPEELRDPDIVPFDVQGEIMDAMFVKLGAVQQAAGHLALEAA
jgi:hypothetical protein